MGQDGAGRCTSDGVLLQLLLHLQATLRQLEGGQDLRAAEYVVWVCVGLLKGAD